MLVADDKGEAGKGNKLSGRHGLPLLALSVSISLDELAMGFTIGLIGLQAFIVAQVGLHLGASANDRAKQPRSWRGQS